MFLTLQGCFQTFLRRYPHYSKYLFAQVRTVHLTKKRKHSVTASQSSDRDSGRRPFLPKCTVRRRAGCVCLYKRREMADFQSHFSSGSKSIFSLNHTSLERSRHGEENAVQNVPKFVLVRLWWIFEICQKWVSDGFFSLCSSLFSFSRVFSRPNLEHSLLVRAY